MFLKRKKENKTRVLTTFNFANYPELLLKYKKYITLRNEFSRITNNNLQGYDDQAILDETEKYAYGEFAEYVFSVFSPIKPNLYLDRGPEKEKTKKWTEVFCENIHDLTKSQRKFLVGMINHDLCLLPPQYYDEKLKFQSI